MEQSKRNGRGHYTAGARQEFVALFEKSNLTQTEFARQHDLKLCTLHQWLHRTRRPTKSLDVTMADRKLSKCLKSLGKDDPSNNNHAKWAAKYFATSTPEAD